MFFYILYIILYYIILHYIILYYICCYILYYYRYTSRISYPYPFTEPPLSSVRGCAVRNGAAPCFFALPDELRPAVGHIDLSILFL